MRRFDNDFIFPFSIDTVQSIHWYANSVPECSSGNCWWTVRLFDFLLHICNKQLEAIFNRYHNGQQYRKMGYNEVEMQFEKLTDNSVRQTNNSYFALTGIMKFLGPLMKGMFKKQTTKYMEAFKAYVEK
jgi:hypothetical protein